jgi:hypothetical protein
VVSTPTDVVILLDASTTSFTTNDFANVKSGLPSLINQYIIAPNVVHLSLITFSQSQTPEFLLNNPTASSYQAVLSYIQNNLNQHTNGVNDYAAALRYVADTVLTTANGARAYTPATVILIAGSISANNAATLQAANRLKATGAYIVSVGIQNSGSGTQVSQIELQAIATATTWLNYLGPNAIPTSAVAIASYAAAANLPGSTCLL